MKRSIPRASKSSSQSGGKKTTAITVRVGSTSATARLPGKTG